MNAARRKLVTLPSQLARQNELRDQTARILRTHVLSSSNDPIEFGYPASVIRSVWNRIKKPSSATIEEIKRKALTDWKARPPANWGEMHRRISGYRFSEWLDDLIKFGADPRPRNDLGMFTSQGEGGPDPNAMVRVYHMPPPQPPQTTFNPVNVAGTAALAAGAGTLTTIATRDLVAQIKKKFKKPKL